MELRVLNEDGASVAPGDRGEIYATGANISPGYAGRVLPGRVVATFLRGRPTVLDGKLA